MVGITNFCNYGAIHDFLEFIDICDCGLTGGCSKCNPFQQFWDEDIEMAEERMEEYNRILLDEDK